MQNEVMFSSKTVEWPTPQYLFDELHREFGFTVDVASTHENAKVAKHYTVEDDGLQQEWGGETVWCNPPYGRTVSQWLQKAIDSKTTCVFLLPSRTDTKWFHELVLPYAEIRFIKGRLKFGNSKTPAPFPSLIAIYRFQYRQA